MRSSGSDRRPHRRCVLAGAALLLLLGCPAPAVRGPSQRTTGIDVPEPGTTDLRDIHPEQRDAFLQAIDDLRSGSIGRARKALEEIEEEGRSSYALDAALAMADLADGAIEAPLKTLERLARPRQSRFLLLCYAAAAEMASDFDAAYVAIEAALELPPREEGAEKDRLRERAARVRHDAAEAHLARGRATAEEGETAEALLVAERGLEAEPEHPGLAALAGMLHVSAGNYQQGAALLERALEASPGAPELERPLAEAYLKSGKLDEAKDLYSRILERDSGDQEARLGLEAAREDIRRLKLPARFHELATLPSITRGDLAALLFEEVRALRDRPPRVRGVVVTDVSGSWAKEYILMAVSQGVMEVYEDHTFGAEERVSRADLADALARCVQRLESTPGELIPSDAYPVGGIDDLPRGHGRYESIVSALSYGLLELSADRAFRPADPATGREAVDAVSRLGALQKGER